MMQRYIKELKYANNRIVFYVSPLYLCLYLLSAETYWSVFQRIRLKGDGVRSGSRKSGANKIPISKGLTGILFESAIEYGIVA